MKTLFVSVVVPAYNAAKTIEICLDSLVKQNYSRKGYEIIVVDDGSKDETKSIILSYKQVRYIYQVNAGPASARNTGWKNAKGDIVVFTDSDCVLEKNWLEEMTKPFEVEDEVGAVGGAYEKTINSDKWLARLIGEEIKFRYSKIGQYTDAHGSYSLAVRKSVLEEVGGFNKSYPVATAEDWDLCYKIIEKGYKIFFNKRAHVGHHHPESLKKYLKTQTRHGFYRMLLYKDHKNMIKGDKYSQGAKMIIFLDYLIILSLILTIINWNYFFLVLLMLIVQLWLQREMLMCFRGVKDKVLIAGLELLRGFAWTVGASLGFWKYFVLGK
jgi:glycosyltransferase involved in cell wall biosynthesis